MKKSFYLRNTDHTLILHGGIACSFFKGSGEIIVVGKAHRLRDLTKWDSSLDQQLFGFVYPFFQQVINNGSPHFLLKDGVAVHGRKEGMLTNIGKGDPLG